MPSPPRLTVAHRHARGRAHLAQVLAYWLGRSGLSYAQLAALADWATGERSIMATSQITHLRHARLSNVNWRLIEALTESNLACWRWHTHGPDACFSRYGPFGSSILTASIMDAATWLPSPDEPGEPLNFAEWCELFAGRIELLYIGTTVEITPREAPLLNQELAQFLNDQLASLNLSPRDAMQALLEGYRVPDDRRRQRLQNLILGTETIPTADLQDDLPRIAAAVAALRGVSNYTERELYAELTQGRRRV